MSGTELIKRIQKLPNKYLPVIAGIPAASRKKLLGLKGLHIMLSPIDPTNRQRVAAIRESKSRNRRPADKNRNELKSYIRSMKGSEFLKCPVCGVDVKPDNLIRHYDKVHKP